MLESQVGRTAGAWRERLAGRTRFDLSAAEAAVRAAYRASGLREPGQIFWADGPTDAARAIIYLERPPRVLRRSTWAILLIGAAVAVILSLALDGVAGGSTWPSAVLWSAVIAGGGLAMGGSPRLPEPPGAAVPSRRRELMLVGVACGLGIATGAFVLLYFGGLPGDPETRYIALACAAAAGTIPGIFLRFRIHFAYSHLARPLAEASPSGTVAPRMEMQRAGAWAAFRWSTTGLRPDDTLLQLHRNAHRDAFVRQQEVLSGVADRRSAGSAADWVAVGMFRDLRTNIALIPPQHLDGMEDASRAAAADGAGSTGTARAFVELAFHVDRIYPFAAHAVAVQPPTAVALDAEGRPHCETGPAIEWADGTQMHAWHGREVPWEVIDPIRPVTFRRISQEVHPDRRAVLIERYGLGRYLLHAGATEVQQDDCGRLYRLHQFIGEPIQAVRVVNSTPEPDGHFKEFWLRVPPNVTTARQAVAWSFGLPASDYEPIAQS